MNRRVFIIVAAVIAFIVTVVTLLSYYGSLVAYTINYTHASSVKIIQVKGTSTSEIATIQKSGDVVRVPSDDSYFVQYTGDDGFASGTKKLSATETTVTIDPDFSEAHYTTLVQETLPAIRSAISKQYPTVTSLFTIDKGAMRDRGTWFVAWLVYKGEYNENSDNLRILLTYENDSWVVKTQPDILLTSTNYPRISVEILSWANAATF